MTLAKSVTVFLRLFLFFIKAIEWSGLKTNDTKMIPKATFLFLANSAKIGNLFSNNINIPLVEVSILV
jgi:hypothetical protein